LTSQSNKRRKQSLLHTLELAEEDNQYQTKLFKSKKNLNNLKSLRASEDREEVDHQELQLES
jgi:hypothetical protein